MDHLGDAAKDDLMLLVWLHCAGARELCISNGIDGILDGAHHGVMGRRMRVLTRLGTRDNYGGDMRQLDPENDGCHPSSGADGVAGTADSRWGSRLRAFV